MFSSVGNIFHYLYFVLKKLILTPINLRACFPGKTMTDATTLADLGVGPNGTIQLELQSADPVNTPIKAYRPRQEYHMPDVITVRVQAGEKAYLKHFL